MTKLIISLFVVSLGAGIGFSSLSAKQVSATQNSSSQDLPGQISKETIKSSSLGEKLPLTCRSPLILEGDGYYESNISVISSRQTLVGTCDVLFMLDTNNEIIWQYKVPQILFDFVFIPSTGLIYGTAGDNNMFILEAFSGRELLRNSRNGSAGYGRVIPYGDDICLVTDDNSGYRFRLNDSSVTDEVTAWRGLEILWHIELPPGAELIVNGSRIQSLTNNQGSIFIKDIVIPIGKSD